MVTGVHIIRPCLPPSPPPPIIISSWKKFTKSVLRTIISVSKGRRDGTELTMNSWTVWFTVSLTSEMFQKSFLLLLTYMGHSSYSWSHVPGFSGGVTIQRSDFTLAFSEISISCFLLPFEKNRTNTISSTIYWCLCKTKWNATQRTNKTILTFPQYIIKCNTITYVLLVNWF